jgi:hypothetical protein
MDQKGSVKNILPNKTFSNYYDKKLKELCCQNLGATNHLNILITYSKPKSFNRFSVIEIEYSIDFAENATFDVLNLTLFISPYRECIAEKIANYSKFLIAFFICELKSVEGAQKEAIYPPLIRFSFDSGIIFKLIIMKISAYYVEDDCGTPDTPLHASYYHYNCTTCLRSIKYYQKDQKSKYRMTDESIINCVYEGNWDKEPSTLEPIIKCNTDQIEMNSSIYKIIGLENFEVFNKTQVAVIDSKILFQCNNEENSSKNYLLTCNESSLWIGDDLECKLVTNIEISIFKIVLIFQAKRVSKRNLAQAIHRIAVTHFL